MSKIQLKEIHEQGAIINFHVNLDVRASASYECDIKLWNNAEIGYSDEWHAEMSFGEMPPQNSPEEAIDRMGLYLRQMAKAMKGKNIKHLNIDTIFKPVHKN